MKQKINGPFESVNKTTQKIYEEYISPNLDAMILSNKEDTLKFLEVFSATLLIELKKKFPDLDHTFSLTYRIKSPKSDIDKLEDYLKRMDISDKTIRLKDLTDLIGMRLIIEKIPHNVSIPPEIPNYEYLMELKQERKKNINLSSEFQDFLDKYNSGSSTPIEYFQESQKVIESILDTLSSKDLKAMETINAVLKDLPNRFESDYSFHCEKAIDKIGAVLSNISNSPSSPEGQKVMASLLDTLKDIPDKSDSNYSLACEKVLYKIGAVLNSNKSPLSYATALKEYYHKQKKTCVETISFLEKWHNYKGYAPDPITTGIDFKQLLSDFTSRIDGKLALQLYSNMIPLVFEDCETLKALGASISTDKDRTKPKREPSGFIADFKGIDFDDLPLKLELQVMTENEYVQSISGYSAHSNMDFKEPSPPELPSVYVKTQLENFCKIGKNSHLSPDQLRLLRDINKIKEGYEKNDVSILISLLDSCTSDSIVNGISIDQEQAEALQRICTLSSTEEQRLRNSLASVGTKLFYEASDHVSALHATAEFDKDSYTPNRVKINYDSPYNKLVHFIAQQSHGPNVNPIKHQIADDYLTEVDKNKFYLFKPGDQIPPSYIIDADISNYLETDFLAFKKKISNSISSNEKKEKEEDTSR